MAFKPQMSHQHEEAFKGAARLYNVYILVRRTNLASLQRIGDPMCVPKRLDCKAKTADKNVRGKQTGGLVVDPTLVGADAFSSKRKYQKALEKWQEFAAVMIDPRMRTLDGQRRLAYVPNGGFYFVDLDPNSVRYGCLKFSRSSVIAAGKYVHGDFDLYGIVRADNPALNVAVHDTETVNALGHKHSRSPEFFDVQHFINGRIGVPMVLHGPQDAYEPTHTDEGIDIFYPDGTITGAENIAEITRLYEKVFKGRQLFTPEGPRQIVRGRFVAPG